MIHIKTLLLILVLNVSFLAVNAQQQSNKLAGATCSCGIGQSTCNSNCTFSDCCVCWNGTTQNGGCGCYWGVATCKATPITASKGISMDDNIFGDVHPDAKITFHFENFKKLSSFFQGEKISTINFENVVNSTSSKYNSTHDNASISNDDFTILLKEYSNMIIQLDENQKNKLNIFIKSL